jgi:hypothetical protein
LAWFEQFGMDGGALGVAYNGLVIAWPELTKLAPAERGKAKDTQQETF